MASVRICFGNAFHPVESILNLFKKYLSIFIFYLSFLEVTILFDPGGGDGYKLHFLRIILDKSFGALRYMDNSCRYFNDNFLENKLIIVIIIMNKSTIVDFFWI